jgi:glycosyltransferase involved in cell wall biosynthesis
VLVHLVEALPRVDPEIEYLLFVTEENEALFARAAGAVELCVVPGWVRSVGSRVLYEMVWMPRQVHRWGADFFFAVNQVASPLLRCPVSSLVQNLLFYYYGQFYGREWNPVLAARRAFFRGLGRWSVQRARQVIAVSETVGQVVAERDRVPFERIQVVPLAPSCRLAPAKGEALEQVRARIGGPFLLYVGALEPYKNLDRAIAALARVRRRPETGKVRLALVGMDRRGQGKRLGQVAREAGVGEEVVLIGPVPHEELGNWYEAAEGVVLLSACEAFPLIPFEAMLRGRPVIASNLSSLPEVVGDGGIMVDPDDEEAVAGAMHRVLTDQAFRQQLVEQGYRRAQGFSWERTARELVGAWRQAMQGIKTA